MSVSGENFSLKQREEKKIGKRFFFFLFLYLPILLKSIIGGKLFEKISFGFFFLLLLHRVPGSPVAQIGEPETFNSFKLIGGGLNLRRLEKLWGKRLKQIRFNIVYNISFTNFSFCVFCVSYTVYSI